jgi:hypothetical protein
MITSLIQVMYQTLPTLPMIQKQVLKILLSSLNHSKLAEYDLHFEQVLKAIKLRDLNTIQRFYLHYGIEENHPLRLLITRLLEPLPIQKNTTLNADYKYDTVTLYDKQGNIIGFLDEETGFIESSNSQNTDNENQLEVT